MGRVVAALVAVLVLAPPALAAPNYTVVAVGTFGASVPSYAYDVNDSNQVVGEYGYASQQRPFRYSGGVNTDLGTLGGFTGSANGINDAGVITGSSSIATCCDRHAFVYSGGTMTDLGIWGGSGSSAGLGINAAGHVVGVLSGGGHGHDLGFLWDGSSINALPNFGSTTAALDIDSAGTIVGGSQSPAGYWEAFSWSCTWQTCPWGVMRRLGTLPGHTDSYAFATNDAGVVVGYSQGTPHQPTAVKWAGGTITNLGRLPGGTFSLAADVNAGGAIVGSAHDATGKSRAVRWNGTTIVDLNSEIPTGSGWYLESATAINDNGAIVGNGTFNGVLRGFLLLPVSSDTTPPSISCGSADGLWHDANVSIACTASDSGSGLADPADASFSLSTSVAAGAEDANASTGTRSVCDKAGNCATAGPIAGNKVDRRAPSISIASPTQTTYVFASVHNASYTCTDGGSGLGTCSGTVANGSAIDTATPGVRAFTVTATDAVGNTATSTVQYTVVATDWAQFHNGLDRTGTQPSEQILDTTTVASLSQSWTYFTGNSVMSSPAIADGILYVGNDSGVMFAINAATGTPVAKAQAGNFVRSSPAVANGVVVVGSDDGSVYAFEAGTLVPRWTFATGGPVYSSPTIAGGIVYVGSGDGNLYALDLQTGQLSWSQYLGGPVDASPAVDGGVVYVGAYDFYALDAATGQLLWTAWFGVGIQHTAAVSGGLVFVGTPYGLFALDRFGGSIVWFAPMNAQVTNSPASDGASVYVGAMDGSLYAFDAGSGGQIWSTYLGSGWVTSSAAYANGVVYVGFSNGWSPGGGVVALDATSGQILWGEKTAGMINSSPAVADGRVYVGSDDNYVYAFSR